MRMPLFNLFRLTPLHLARQAIPLRERLHSIENRSLVVLDFETTGADSEASIREVGAVKLTKGIDDCFHSLLKPKHGVNLDEYRKLMDRATVAFPKLIEFCDKCHVVAHNASFEKRFLYQIYQKFGDTLDFDQIVFFCTYRIAAKLIPLQKQYKLSKLAKKLELEYPCSLKPHRALDDVFMTKLLWDEFIAILNEHSVPEEKHQECLFNIQSHSKELTSEIMNIYSTKQNKILLKPV